MQAIAWILLLVFPLAGLGADSPSVKEGLIDLRDWNFGGDGPVALNGDWEFYWQEQLSSYDLFLDREEDIDYLHVPGVWNGHVVGNGTLVLDGRGFATYRVNILIGPLEPFGLKLPDLGTAYRLLVDGREIFKAGEPGVDAASTKPRYYPTVVTFTPKGHRVEIILHVSNFDHRLGGAWLPILFGTASQLDELREDHLARDLVLFGAIFIIGLYNLALWALRRENTPPLYLGLFCVLLAFRILLVGDRYFTRLFPDLAFEWYVRIEYLAWYLAVPAFTAYLRHTFPREIHKYAAGFIYGSFGIGALVVLLGPVSVSSFTVPVFQTLTVAALIYGTGSLIQANRHQRPGARILLFAYIILFISIISDMLVNAGYLDTILLLDLGLFIFVFSQSLLISYRFTLSFRTIEQQREQLQSANIQLKTQEKLRRDAEMTSETLHDRISRSEKMEAIGLLAGGVAHDLNNILSNTVTYPELALLDLPEDHKLYKPLELTRQAGLRAAAVIQDLLTLARRGSIVRETINLNTLIEEYLESIELQALLTAAEEIRIETDLEDGLSNIEASPVHIQKLLMNLVSNSIDAIENGGTITITTHNEDVQQKSLFYSDLETGNYVVLTIEDTGTGIDPHDLDKIFEPFHTTKVMGQSGTGLGMSVVWGVVQDHHGGIDVMSHPGEGTRFEIYFPATTKAMEPAPAALPVDRLKGHGERVLIVDDLADQRRLTEEVLIRLGYQPSSCASGEEAAERLQEEDFDLILLDMVMDKGWDGPRTFMELIRISPGQKIILVSGFADVSRIRDAHDMGASGFVKKPFTLETIGRAIQKALNE